MRVRDGNIVMGRRDGVESTRGMERRVGDFHMGRGS